MGKYIRKCKAVGDVAVMDVSPVGVRTRARTLALAAADGTGKRIVSDPGDLRTVRMPEDSENSDDRITADRCSSNGSSELVKEWLRSADSEMLEIARDFHFTDRREATPSSSSDLCFESGNHLESSARSLEMSSYERSTAEKMPSEEEIDAFFSKLEKEEQRRFAERYNYDVVKDVPLDGSCCVGEEALVSLSLCTSHRELLVLIPVGKEGWNKILAFYWSISVYVLSLSFVCSLSLSFFV